MSEGSPTRSRLIALRLEQRAMQEGYAFLDEKCMVLAGAMLREVRRHDALLESFAVAQREADAALQAAVARHGVEGLSVYPASPAASLAFSQSHESLLGIALWRAELAMAPSAPVAAAVFPSPEAELCRSAFVRLAQAATALAASVGNLVRLEREYRRTVRRASSLHDVVLPELEREAVAIDGQLEELERDEALWVRGAQRGKT